MTVIQIFALFLLGISANVNAISARCGAKCEATYSTKVKMTYLIHRITFIFEFWSNHRKCTWNVLINHWLIYRNNWTSLASGDVVSTLYMMQLEVLIHSLPALIWGKLDGIITKKEHSQNVRKVGLIYFCN